MKQILTLLLLWQSLSAIAQADTTIYKVVSESPRFPGCEQLDTTLEAKNQCAQSSLLYFFSQNLSYPWEAREQDIQGTVVISLVVEKDGYVSNPVVIRDIGGGCGAEAIRVAAGMNEALKQANLAWAPGKLNGKVVRTQVTIPIKFKLEEPLDYVLLGQFDTVYVVLDDSVGFKGGEAALADYLQGRLQLPALYKDSCRVGEMDLSLLVRPDGSVRVVELTDYWGLGGDFQWEAIAAATSTWGKWNPAVRKGRQVPALYDLKVFFKPLPGKCSAVISDYERAMALAEEGSAIFGEGRQEEGLQKLSEAVNLFPQNANFLYMRGQAYMNMKMNDKACEDFMKVRDKVSLDMVNQLIPMLCP
jgi:hypothetical protein